MVQALADAGGHADPLSEMPGRGVGEAVTPPAIRCHQQRGGGPMSHRPVSLDHVNIHVRSAERSQRWYTDILGLHTQDAFTMPETGRLRAVFLAADPEHAHDIALFEVGEDAPGPQTGQVGLSHIAWRMASLDDLKEMYQRLKDRGVPIRVVDHTISIGIYFSDPDGNGLEVYYELPRAQWHVDRPFSTEGRKGRFPGPWDEARHPAAAAPASVP
jgi:catechol 2,3-dioxygenase